MKVMGVILGGALEKRGQRNPRSVHEKATPQVALNLLT